VYAKGFHHLYKNTRCTQTQVRDALKVGFLNRDVEKNLATYEKIYDHVIKNDGDMYFPIALVRNLLVKQEKRKKKLSVDVTSDKVVSDKVIYVSKSNVSEKSEKDLSEEEKQKIRFAEDEERRALLKEIQERRRKFLKSRLELHEYVRSYRVEDEERHRLMREIRKRERDFLSPRNTNTPKMMNILEQDIQRRREELIRSNNSALNRDFMTHPQEYHTTVKTKPTRRTPPRIHEKRGQQQRRGRGRFTPSPSKNSVRGRNNNSNIRGTKKKQWGLETGKPSPALYAGNKFVSPKKRS